MRKSKQRDALAEVTGAERGSVVEYQPGRHSPPVWQTGDVEVYVVSPGGPPAGHAGYSWKLLAERPDEANIWDSDGPALESEGADAPAPTVAFVPEHHTLVTTATKLGRVRSKVGARYRDGRRPGARGFVSDDGPGYLIVTHDDGTRAGYVAEELSPVPHPPELAAPLAALRRLGFDAMPYVHADWAYLGSIAPGERHVVVWFRSDTRLGLLAQDESHADDLDAGIGRIEQFNVVARAGEELETLAPALARCIREHARLAHLVAERARTEAEEAEGVARMLRADPVLHAADPAKASAS